MKDVEILVKRIADVRREITAAMAMPAAARKELATAVIGHKNWNGYGLQEVRNADVHRAAIDAVTDKLVSDLAARKQAEIAELADELDGLRNALAIEADKARFDLLDDVREAREWRYGA
jgi:hypothetical protein